MEVADDEVPLVCAPPLLLTVTPGATCVLESVTPVAPVVVALRFSEAVWSADGGSFFVTSDVAVVFRVVDEVASWTGVDEDLAAAEAEDVELDDGEPDEAELEESFEDSELDLVGSALATLGEVMAMTPIPSAAAKAPTRPM